jgi:hypothetical protein
MRNYHLVFPRRHAVAGSGVSQRGLHMTVAQGGAAKHDQPMTGTGALSPALSGSEMSAAAYAYNIE